MKKTTLLIVLFFACSFLKAQDLHPIDAKVAQYPKTFSEAKELADLINNDFETERDKARAIYSWITKNVQFDIDAHYAKKKRKRLKYKDRADRARKLRNRRIQVENKALQKHLAVAEGYATLYKTLCDLSGIYGYILKGTGKFRTFEIGKQPRVSNHTWNVIQLDKEWYNVDATMGAGVVDYTNRTFEPDFNDKFFLTPREKFFLNHYPKDAGWTFLEKTADDFANLPLFYGEYLKNDLELVQPELGILDLKGKDSIQIAIKAPIPLETLTYQYSFDKEPAELSAQAENGLYSFEIPFLKKRGGYLTLYYKKKAIISYKIGAY